MKKILSIMMVAAFCFVSAMSISSCSKDDNNTTSTSGSNEVGGGSQTENNSLTDTEWICYIDGVEYTLEFYTSSTGLFSDYNYNPGGSGGSQRFTYTYDGDQNSGNGTLTRYPGSSSSGMTSTFEVYGNGRYLYALNREFEKQ